MNRPTLDVGAIALGLAAVGFGLVLLFSGSLLASFIQPILAAILIAAGGVGLLLSRVHPSKRKAQK
ncbi:MAG: hypothetical protein QM713_04535 [Arachnia sp.]